MRWVVREEVKAAADRCVVISTYDDSRKPISPADSDNPQIILLWQSAGSLNLWEYFLVSGCALMRRSNLVLAQLLLGAVVHAQTPPEPLAWPPGYFNARTATDAAKPQPVTTPKELKLARTHHSLSIEWHIDGDTDHDAACKVSYKREDEPNWHEAMPLMRVDYFGWYDTKPAARPFNMLAGSILFLRPGAVYQVRLTLSDPDSAAPVEETKRIQTKPWPSFAKPSRTLHVVPHDVSGGGGDGSAGKPFRGLKPALGAAKPGDLFLLHAGDYGETEINVSGAQGSTEAATDQTRYISFKTAGDGEAVFHQLRASGSHLWFEGLSFKRGDSPNGLKGGDGCENVIVRGCTFRDFHYSVFLS